MARSASSNQSVIAISIAVNSDRHGVEISRPDRKLTDTEFKTLNELQTKYHLTWFGKYQKYIARANRVDMTSLLKDKRFAISKSASFDEDFKKAVAFWKSEEKASATKSKTTKTAKTATPTVAPSNASDEKLDKLINAVDTLAKRQDTLEEMFKAFMANCAQ